MRRYNYYGDALVAAIPADIKEVTDGGNTIYTANYDRGSIDDGTDVHSQAIWSITKTVITVVNNVTTIKTLYPNGSNIFRFAWADRANLNYEYLH